MILDLNMLNVTQKILAPQDCCLPITARYAKVIWRVLFILTRLQSQTPGPISPPSIKLREIKTK